MSDDDPKLHYGTNQLRAILIDLHRDHVTENPFALHEVLNRSREWQLPLPDWAVDALKVIIADYLTGKAAGKVGRDNSPIGTYRNKVIVEMHRRTYKSIMAWLRAPRRDAEMPKRIIQLWYQKKIKYEHTNEEKAIKLALEALAPTFAACSESTLLEARYYDPLRAVSDIAREHHHPPILVHDFGIEETAWVSEFLTHFGPPGPPPDHILTILKKQDNVAKE